jgi:hypothetical protein
MRRPAPLAGSPSQRPWSEQAEDDGRTLISTLFAGHRQRAIASTTPSGGAWAMASRSRCSRARPVARRSHSISQPAQFSTLNLTFPPGSAAAAQTSCRSDAAEIRSRLRGRRSAMSADMVAAIASVSSEALSRRPPLSLMQAAYSW